MTTEMEYSWRGLNLVTQVGREVAARMAQHLVELARGNGITTVKAQTLPKVSASTRILEKLGFHCVGPISHPEDGEVWEWHI